MTVFTSSFNCTSTYVGLWENMVKKFNRTQNEVV